MVTQVICPSCGSSYKFNVSERTAYIKCLWCGKYIINKLEKNNNSQPQDYVVIDHGGVGESQWIEVLTPKGEKVVYWR